MNYEHDRHQRLSHGSADSDAAGKSALKNYKLKFSRLMTGFSMVAWLVSVEGPGKEGVARACRLTPRERLRQVAANHEETDRFEGLMRLYGEFLDVTQAEKPQVVKTFSDRASRASLMETATDFGDEFFDLIWRVARDPIRRYLVI